MGNIATTENLGWLGLGAGTWYGLVAIFAFYPAFILAMAGARMFMGEPEQYVDVFPAHALTVMLFLVFIAIIAGLTVAKQYFIVLMMYIITAWPFLNILGHWANAGGWDHGVKLDYFPLPLDWWPLW